MDQANLLRTKPLSTARIESIPAIVSRLWEAGKAFGVNYSPENQSVKISVCQPDQLITLREVSALTQFKNEFGFAVFPFNLKLNPAFFIPNLDNEFENTPPKNTKEKSDLLLKETDEATESSYYQKQVGEAVSAIKNNRFTKLVLSRSARYHFQNEDVSELVARLFANYPNAHITLFHLPKSGLWLSASPEILAQQVGKNLLKTVALAGTMTFHGQELKGQGWTEKEIEEQALVSRFVKSSLKDANFHLYEEKGPITIPAGNLLHLRTDFLIHSTDPEDFGNLAQALHPTSAVCGSPRNEALDWLSEHEDFDREYYAGCAGPIEPNQSRLVVLLRTGKLVDGKITLFAGAGITGASDPKKEWAETGEKLKTLLRLSAKPQLTV